jgi:2-amino-4-hydroxy-6-hydroxymethyldihydropteridine diphosphokinase
MTVSDEGRTPVVSVYVGLGSNLENPARQIMRALAALGEIPDTRLLEQSSLYISKPLGPRNQPDFVNAVAALATSLTPEALLASLQAIETRQGRNRDSGRRWGPRTLDLDLLVYGDRMIETPALTVPHPGIGQRSFVLLPLQEIAPDYVIPGLGALKTLVEECDRTGIHKLDHDTL